MQTLIEMSDFLDFIIYAMCALGLATVGLAVWSAAHGLRTRERQVDGLAARHTSKVGYVTVALTALLLLGTYLAGSTSPLLSNGQPFTDVSWLKATDMLIYTPLILIAACFVIIAIAKFRR